MFKANYVELLQAINDVQMDYIAERSPRQVFDHVLSTILKVTQSEYGFIGKVLYNDDGEPYLKTYAITNISWNDETREFYEQNAPQGLEFYNLNTLFGYVITSEKPLITNDPMHHTSSGGIPEGHPPLTAFLGVPLHRNGRLVGMAGIANREQGYDETILEFIQPLLTTSANIIEACATAEQNAKLVQELHGREAELRSIFDNTVDGIISINEHGIIQSVNPASESMFGYSRDELVGENIRILMPEPDRSNHDGYIQNYHATGDAKIIGIGREVNALAKDGNIIPIELAVNEMVINGKQMFVGILRDVTQRQQAEQQLQKTMSIQRAILDSANYTIISTDIDGVIKTFNSGAQRMLRYSESDVIDKVTPEVIHDKDEVVERAKILSQELNTQIEPGFEVFVAKARLGIPDENVWTYIRKDGSRFPVMLSVTALYNDAGEITGFLGIGSDITERLKIDQMKNEFVSSVSHELRTPLTSIKGALGIIEGGAVGEIPESVKDMVTISINNCERLIRLVNDILDVEKMESGAMTHNPRVHNIKSIINQSLSDTITFANKFDVSLRLEKCIDNAYVLADYDRMLQVMANLLSNAIKYSPRGAEVTVRVDEQQDSFKVSVQDCGDGIPDEYHDNIFDKFVQVDSSSTRKKGGTGLGLNISKQIVEKHEGILDFTSKLAEGSTFFFTLPKLKEQFEDAQGAK